IFSMLINSFTLSALCLFGAFLTSCSNKNNFLTPLIIMPLSIPILIIAINMAQNIDANNNLLLISLLIQFTMIPLLVIISSIMLKEIAKY
ncbi:MAG: hypothetical protein AAF195_00075, partial [Pseudomonadota bacterium]